MNTLIVLLIFIILAYSISLIWRFKPLESIFIGVFSIFYLLIVLVYLTSLSISVYFILSAIFILLITSLVLSIKNKTFFNISRNFISNPIFIIWLLVIVVYIFVSQGTRVYGWDSITHWLLLPKYILKFDGFKIVERCLNDNQSVGLPVFYAFTSFLTGFKESNILSIQWILYWTCILLPFSHKKYNNLTNVFIYCIVAFCVLMDIPNSYQNVYSDGVLTLLWCCVSCYFVINKEKKASFTVMFISFLILPFIKADYGILFFCFVMSFVLFDMIYNKNLDKKNVSLVASSILGLFLNIGLIKLINENILYGKSNIIDAFFLDENTIVSLKSQAESSKGYIYDFSKNWATPIESVINSLISPIGLALTAIVVFGMVFLFLSYAKNKKNNIYILISTIAVFSVLGVYVLLNLDRGTTEIIKHMLYHFRNKEFMNFKFVILIDFIIIAYCYYYFHILKEDCHKYFTITLFIVVFQFLIVIAATMYGYSTYATDRYIVNGISFKRYIGIYFYFFVLYISSMILDNNELYKKLKKSWFVIILTCAILIHLFAPDLNAIIKTRDESSFGISKQEVAGKEIKEAFEKDEKLCVLFDLDRNTDAYRYDEFYIRYFSEISLTNMIFLSTELNFNDQQTILDDFVKKYDIKQIYYFNSSEGEMVTEFNDYISPFFVGDNPIEINSFYDVTFDDNDHVVFKKSN